MKVNIVFHFAIVLASCSGISQRQAQSKPVEQDWKVAKIITQEHTYNNQGLLDTTKRIESYYVNGQIGEVMNFLIIRTYDTKNNLVRQKTFQLLKRKNELSEEKIFQYDTRNNLILETIKFDNKISNVTNRKYNELNQKIEEMTIQENIDHFPNEQPVRYDTSSISFQYDVRGNLIKEFYKDNKQEIVETLTTIFSNNQKALTFGISPEGDTTLIFNFINKGDLMTEIRHDKVNPLLLDTVIYNGGRIVQSTLIDMNRNYRRKETYRYDKRGNEIENISYR